MREIIFRGKRPDNGEWLYGFPVTDQGIKCGTPNCVCKHDGSDVYVMYFWDYDSHEFDEFDVDPETVGQYTGKDDCNGKPMFEGDIVKTNLGHIQTIEWSNDYCAFVCIEKGYDKPCQVDILDEIIGNIHDNPELLEVQG